MCCPAVEGDKWSFKSRAARDSVSGSSLRERGMCVGTGQGPVSGLSALAYATRAVQLIEEHALARHRVDWAQVRMVVERDCADVSTLSETYATIEWVLGQLGDGHSFFSPPDRGTAAIASGTYSDEVAFPTGRMTADGIATLIVPGFRGTARQVDEYSDQLRELILSASDARGWVVDLTGNWGGNMFPMLTGLAPLLGEGCIGGFEFVGGAREDWRLDPTGSLWVGEWLALGSATQMNAALARSPVALLIGPQTASSGEAVAVAFSGRPMSRTFGLQTKGISTANETFDLSDGASLAVTVARFVDRNGVVFGGSVEPDEAIDDLGDSAVEAATSWILAGAPD